MIETTISQLRQLKLNGMASALQTQREQPGTYEGLAFAEATWSQSLPDWLGSHRHGLGTANPTGSTWHL